MKFKITMKDPDGFYDAIQEAAEEWAKEITAIDEDERESIVESRKEKLQEITKEWFEYSEYLTVEIDTETQSIAVVKP